MPNSDIDVNPLFIDQVYHRLRDAIAMGDLKSGERVRQSALAERLGVSRQPISHALQLLKRQGLVRDAGKQGVEVTPVDPDFIVHLYEARTALEAHAARLAAERMRADPARPPSAPGDPGLAACAQELSSALERGEAAARSGGGLATLVRADCDFHVAIYRLSRNPVIEQMMAGQWPHLMRSMMAVLDDPGVPYRAWEEHAQIAHRILAGEADEAADLCTRHLQRAGADLHRRLKGLSTHAPTAA